MADIAASNVAYSESQVRVSGGVPYKKVRAKLVFGNGALTYPTGGVPLDKNKLGLPNEIKSLVIVDAGSANGFLYKYDLANNKLRIYQGDNDNAADAALIELVGGAATPAAATLVVDAEGW